MMKRLLNCLVLVASLLEASAQAGDLQAPQYLQPGQSIFSNNGAYRLQLQSGDGNLVLKRVADSAVLWSAYSSGGVVAKVQEDRNFVVYSNGGNLPAYALWNSNTSRDVWDTQARLTLRDDGSLYLYVGPGWVVWATPPDAAHPIAPSGKIPFAICLRPGSSARSTIYYPADNYNDALNHANAFINDGAFLGECR